MVNKDLKEGCFYKSGSSVFLVLKVNNRKDGRVSINCNCYYGNTFVYAEDLLTSLFEKFIPITDTTLLKELIL